MQRLSTIRWQTPPPTSVDEELVAYDDGSVWLVVRSPRDGSSTIGTWSATPPPDEHTALVAVGDLTVDLLHAGSVVEAAERLRTAALAGPVATAQFLAAPGADGTVTLAAVGGGNRPAAFELDPANITVHVEKDGATVAWFEVAAPITGFVTPDAGGLGGLGRYAEIPPGAFGAIALGAPGLDAVAPGPVAVQLSGTLAASLPDDDLPHPFRVRACAAG